MFLNDPFSCVRTLTEMLRLPTVGLYEDGQPGELFITMAKEGSTVGGLMDVIGTCTSMALQTPRALAYLIFGHTPITPQR